MTDITISQHAVERFIERSRKNGMAAPHNPQKTILKLLQMAQADEKMDPAHRVKRLISSLAEAKYYVVQGWRFVLDKEGKTVLTVEREKHEQN